jgi:ATP-dependent exoDNAse (exonuclease V) beta subunit
VNRPADWQQREAGRDPSRSFIVQAPAGSGKTELLTQRMLVLLSRVEQPEEVVAITFTRKAAAEMSHRLLKRLIEARDNPAGEGLEPHLETSHALARAVLENDASREWQLLDQPSRLRIRTIDSLCSDLARQLPILSGLGGGQQVAEDPEPLYLQAATRTMAAIEEFSDERHGDVARILDRYDNQYDRLVGLLTEMLGKRDQWQQALRQLWDGETFDRHTLEHTLRELVELELADIAASVPQALWEGLGRTLDYAVTNDPTDAEALYALLEQCARPDGSIELSGDADALPHWVTLVRRFLTAEGKSVRKAPDVKAGFPAPSKAKGDERQRRQHWKEDFTARLDLLREQEGLREKLATVLRLPTPAYDEESWESLLSLMHILLRCRQEWLLVMAESGQADFIEIAERALEALGNEGEPSEFALRLDYRIQHLLVDEFQDTSHSQIRLLERLTAGWTAGDGRSLFLVGDPMQSIYRFRKAEVSLFIEAFEGRLFEQLALERLQLNVNFRSAAAIVNWVNETFPAVMPDHNDPVKGAVSYSPAAARPGASETGGAEINLNCAKDDRAEAEQVIELVRGCEMEKTTAILVRSRKHAAEILSRLDALKQKEGRYRYRAVQFNPLAETPLVQDLVSLTLAILQPVDRLAWLSVLRAPFAGLDLADLECLAGSGSGQTLPEVLQNYADEGGPDLSPAGFQRIRRIAPILGEAQRLQGRARIRDVVRAAWQAMGGPACVGNESELHDAAVFFELLEKLEGNGQAINRETLDGQLESLWAEPDAQATGHLLVMTVYAAKGLEFDTVILPGLNKDTGSDGQKLVHWFELADRDRIVLSPMRNVEEKESAKRSGDLVKFISGVERERQKLENGRLLYVAATRAVERLYLFGDVQPDRHGNFKPGTATLLTELWPAVHSAQERALGAKLEAMPEPENGENRSEIPQFHRRLDAGWKPPSPPDPLPVTGPGQTEAAEFIQFRWAGEDARLTGDLVHRILQQVAETGLEAWAQNGGFNKHQAWCRRQLLAAGITGKRTDHVLRRTARAVNTCISSERGRWILADHEQAASEYAITAVIDGRPANFILDRTFIDDDVRWIIDYKTSSHSGGDLEGFLDNEEERYREQLRRYRDAMALGEMRPIRTALYFPLLGRFREVDLP